MERQDFRWYAAMFVQQILRSIGLKTINGQFLFSYILIFIFASVSAVSLYFNMDASANTLNMAGAQRMLSQRVAKEALLTTYGVEQQITVNATITRFEQVHQALLNGSAELDVERVDDPVARRKLEEVGVLWASYKGHLVGYMRNPDASVLESIHGLSPKVLKTMNQAVGLMAERANAATTQQQYLAMATTLGILLLVVLGRMFGLTWLMNHIDELKLHLQAVSKADFSKKLDIQDSGNEIGQIFEAYNEMLQQVGNLIHNVTEAAGQVSSGTAQMRSDLSEAAHGVDQQHMEISQVASAMNQMTATVQEVSNHSQQAADAAQNANEEAYSGKKVVVSTQQNIKDMADQVAHASVTLKKLEDDSNAVGQVLSVITNIAEQTNLLALNAAIEAARAGEQGRGFAVVADEVRTLAQRTQQSITEIRETIERLQFNAKDAVVTMEQSQQMAGLSVEQTTEANNALGRIVEVVNVIVTMNSQIATATEEQKQVSAEMDQNISSIAAAASQTTETTKQTVDTSNTINAQIDQLQSLVKQFQV